MFDDLLFGFFRRNGTLDCYLRLMQHRRLSRLTLLEQQILAL